PELQFYQLAIPAPSPRPGVDFDAAAASRGDALFSGKAVATTVMSSRFGLSRAGIYTRPPRLALIVSRPIARQRRLQNDEPGWIVRARERPIYELSQQGSLLP